MRFVDVPTGAPLDRPSRSPAAFHRAFPDTLDDDPASEAPTASPTPERTATRNMSAPEPRPRVPLAPTRRPHPLVRTVRRAWSDLRWSLSTLLHSRRRSLVLAHAAARTEPGPTEATEPVYVVFGAPA